MSVAYSLELISFKTLSEAVSYGYLSQCIGVNLGGHETGSLQSFWKAGKSSSKLFIGRPQDQSL